MKQFYSFTLSDTGDPVVVHFNQPVRKILINVLSSFVACSVGLAKDGENMFIIGSLQDIVIDFQRANTGKSVQDLTFWRYSGTGSTRVSISVEEYGSDADNAYFK